MSLVVKVWSLEITITAYKGAKLLSSLQAKAIILKSSLVNKSCLIKSNIVLIREPPFAYLI
jgi:hypothetical protein